MGDDGVRAEAVGLVDEAEAHCDAGDAGGTRGVDIVRRVAQKDGAPAPRPLDHGEQRRGIGLQDARPQRVAGDYRVEVASQAEVIEQRQGEALLLIGADREPRAAFLERLQHGERAGIGHGVVGDMLCIISGEDRQDPRHFFRRPGIVGLQGPLDEDTRSTSHEALDVGKAVRRQADLAERVVHGIGEILRAVDERAVEIEADNVEGDASHARSHALSTVAQASQTWQRVRTFQQPGSIALSTPPLAVVILAAGQGTRMKSSLHKVLHPIAGRPMLLHLLASVGELGPARQVVVVGAGREQVEQAVAGKGVDIAVQAEQLGTGHAVAQAEVALAGFDGDVLILYGDVPLVRAETMRAMIGRLHGDDAPACVVLGFRPADPGAYGRIIADADGHIARMVEYKDASADERAVTLCNSGLMAVRAADLFALLGRVGNDNAAGEYYLPDIVMLAARDGRASAVIETDADQVAGVNSRIELAALEASWQAARRIAAMRDGATLLAPETVFFSHDTALGRDVVIEPNVVFGPGVSVADAVVIHAFSHLEGARIETGASVGPYARLRPGTVIGDKAKVGNFVEIKAAVLGSGAKVNHLSYIGDARVGANANIGAGTITCNYDGFLKYGTEIGAGAFIGSNSALVAPVSIGDGAIVGAGSVITRDVSADALALVRPPQQEKAGWAAQFRVRMAARKAKT